MDSQKDGIACDISGCPSKLVKIVADDREKSSGVIEHLLMSDTVSVAVQRLELRDYLINDRVLVERKTVQDLSASIVDGRLFSQACMMAESAYRPVLLIEGRSNDGNGTGVAIRALIGPDT